MRLLINCLLILTFMFSTAHAKTVTLCDGAFNRQELEVADLNNLAVEIMRQVTKHKTEGSDTVLGWMKSIKESERTRPLNVMEHVTLVFILKSGIFDNYSDPQVSEALKESIRISYKHLVHRDIEPGQEPTPLPDSLLIDGSLAATVFHDAIVKLNPAVKLRQSLGHYSTATAATVLLTAVALCFEPGRNGLAGSIVGLTQASINEDMIHIGVGHASDKMAHTFRKFGAIGQFLENITLAHRLHHTVVSFNFGAAVLTPEQKIKADKILRTLSEKLVLDRIRQRLTEDVEKKLRASAEYWEGASPEFLARPEFRIPSDAEIRALPEFKEKVERLVTATQKGNYGVNGTWKGAVGMLASAAPFYIMNYAVYALTGSEVFLYTADISLTTMILQSLYSHYYLHLHPNDYGSVKTNPVQMYYLEHTWLGRLARRLHYRHHKLPHGMDQTRNGVIMAGSVYDRLVGNLEMPNIDDLIQLYFGGYLEEGTTP